MKIGHRTKGTLAALAIVAVVAGIGVQVYTHTRSLTTFPKFSFDESKAPGWWSRDNINVQAVARGSNYTGETPIDKLPVADITIFQGEEQDEKIVDGCFVSFSYYDFTLDDIEAAYDDYFGRKELNNGKLEAFEPVKQSITTFEGNNEYDLRQYRLTIEGQDIMQGYQVGFIPLSAGYIRTEGVCKTYEELASTEAVLSPVQLLER